MIERIGPYEVVAELATGGMAQLYIAVRSGPAGFRRPVAIKTVQRNLTVNPGMIAMFLDEARLAARIQHKNVIGIEELGETEKGLYLAMEYVHGASLAHFLATLSAMQRRLTPPAAAAIGMQIAAGLHAAHELRGDNGELLNLVHRDVSPQNVLLGAMGEVKLIDFGIAKAEGRLHQTMGTEVKGKLRYMSPEQLKGGTVDRRCDIFSLGIVLWEMLTMRRLFKHMGDVEVIQRITKGDLPPPGAYCDAPFDVDRLVLDCLSADPSKRPATAREVRTRLKESLPDAVDVGDAELAALLWAVVPDLATPSFDLPTPKLSTLELDIAPAQALQKLTVQTLATDEEDRTTLHVDAQESPFRRISADPGDEISETGPSSLPPTVFQPPPSRSSRPASRAWHRTTAAQGLFLALASALSVAAGYLLHRILG